MRIYDDTSVSVPSDPSMGPVLDFLRVLWRLNHGLERRSRYMHATLGVTAPQRMVIRVAGQFPGITAGELARVLHVDPGTLSTALARLEELGHVERQADQHDSRRVHVVLTASGRRLDRESHGTVESAVASALDQLSPETYDLLKNGLDHLAAALNAEVSPRTKGPRSARKRGSMNSRASGKRS